MTPHTKNKEKHKLSEKKNWTNQYQEEPDVGIIWQGFLKHPFFFNKYQNKKSQKINGICRGGAKMAEEWDGDTNFSPTNSSKEQLNAQQISQNNFWSLAEDIRRPEKQPIVFEGR